MNLRIFFKQFWTLIWLRFKLSTNQIKKAGKLNVVLSAILFFFVILATVSSFFVTAIGGAFWFREASANTVLMTWSILAGIFLIMWLFGLLAEVQQTELMSMDKLLHLPISLRGAFFLNYTSSFFNTLFLLGLPTMLGLAVGTAIALGPRMLIGIPLVIAFLFLVTTLSYQLRGWLARIMENKRKRGTVMVLFVLVIVGASQLPNVIISGVRGSKSERKAARSEMLTDIRQPQFEEIETRIELGLYSELDRDELYEEVNVSSYDVLQERYAERAKEIWDFNIGVVEKVDTYFPPGWLPLGMARAINGKHWPAGLGILGMFGIGLVSLAFSFRASMRKYTGVEKRSKTKAKAEVANGQYDEFLFKKLPLVSEQVSAVAVAGFRGLIRSPESKMILIFPLIMGMLGASFLFRAKSVNIPPEILPWIPVGVIAMVMFGMTSLMFNHFGIDRDGFRAFVLSPLSRKDILLGKNIAVAPLAIGISLILLLITQVFIPQSVFAFAGSLLQILCIYLLYCILGNLLSIFCPIGVKRGSMQPANPRFLPMVVLVLGSVLGPALLTFPTGVVCSIPALLETVYGQKMDWLFLLLSAIQLAATWYGYLFSLRLMADLLWKREPRILETVANIPE